MYKRDWRDHSFIDSSSTVPSTTVQIPQTTDCMELGNTSERVTKSCSSLCFLIPEGIPLHPPLETSLYRHHVPLSQNTSTKEGSYTAQSPKPQEPRGHGTDSPGKMRGAKSILLPSAAAHEDKGWAGNATDGMEGGRSLGELWAAKTNHGKRSSWQRSSQRGRSGISASGVFSSSVQVGFSTQGNGHGQGRGGRGQARVKHLLTKLPCTQLSTNRRVAGKEQFASVSD